MLMYAWDRARDIENINIDKIKGNNFYDLLALVLYKSISNIIKKGIYKEYKPCYEETPTLKGKINFDDSLKRDREVDKELLDDISSSFKRYISNKKRLTDKYICPLKEKNFSLYPDTFIITGDADIVKDEGLAFYEKLVSFSEKSKYLNVEFLEHGFIDFNDDIVKEEIYNKINEFL